jgi:hypothetical protein
VNRRLVLHLPRHFGHQPPKPVFKRNLPTGGEILGIEKGNVDVSKGGMFAVTVEVIPHKASDRACSDYPIGRIQDANGA